MTTSANRPHPFTARIYSTARVTRYRACWIDFSGRLQLGDLTAREFAVASMITKKTAGMNAWVQDDQNNKVDQ